MPATNKQFAISAGAGSQKRLFKFESESPVQTAVSRHLRQAAKRAACAFGRVPVGQRGVGAGRDLVSQCA